MTRISDTNAVSITGFDCRCAAGATAQSSARAILDGNRPYSYVDGIETVQGRSYPVFPLPPSALPAGYSEMPETIRCGELALISAKAAITHAGLHADELAHARVGICIGTTAGNSLNNDPFYGRYLSGEFPEVDSMLEFRSANPAAYVGNALGVTGPCETITNACSSGAVAIGEAAQWIASGRCDVVIAGGSEKLCPVVCHGFASLLIADSSPCRPFDSRRMGLNLGAGAGMVVLESAGFRGKSNKKIRGSLVGYGNASDAYHLSAPDPQGSGLRAAMTEALAQSGVSVDELAFVLAHGTGTKDNDAMETSVFAEMTPDVPFFSVKGCTGHTLGAAGAIEAVLTLVYLNMGVIPASAGFEVADTGAAMTPITSQQRISGDYAVTDSIAFGGNCGVLVLKGGEA